MAEYVTALGLDNEPAFEWLVSYNPKKRDRVIAESSNLVCKQTHKFGIKIPTNIKEALTLDKKNENEF